MRVFQIELEISHRADSKTVTGLVTLHKAAITPRLRNIRAETNDLALQMTHYQSHKRFVYRVIWYAIKIIMHADEVIMRVFDSAHYPSSRDRRTKHGVKQDRYCVPG